VEVKICAILSLSTCQLQSIAQSLYHTQLQVGNVDSFPASFVVFIVVGVSPSLKVNVIVLAKLTPPNQIPAKNVAIKLNKRPFFMFLLL
jgi:hypothetical protein